MKILFVNHSSTLTGSAISCLHLMTGMRKDITPFFASRQEGPLIDMLRTKHISSFVIDKKGFLGLSSVAAFLRIIRANHIEVMHLNTLTPFCKYAGIAAFLHRIPVIWVVREDPLISRSRRLRFWLRLLSSRIVFVDDDTRRKLLPEDRWGRVSVVHNGVDLEVFRSYRTAFLHERFGLDRDIRLIGYIGMITRRKGLTYLIEAMSAIKKDCQKVRLVIIGSHAENDLPYVSEINQLIRNQGLEEDVLFTGGLADVRDALNSLELVVLPSLDERCSRALLEAIASAKAVVATGVGGTPEIIHDGINGILVEPGNAGRLAGAILTLLKDEVLRQRMARNGRALAEEHFSVKGTMERMRTIYEEVGAP